MLIFKKFRKLIKFEKFFVIVKKPELSKSPIDKMWNVQLAQINWLGLQKMYILAIRFTYYQKVIHKLLPEYLNKIKLYTGLSTLSTLFIYLCRMDNLVSRTKMRFVTYDKSTKSPVLILIPAWLFNCRIIKKRDNKLTVINCNLANK